MNILENITRESDLINDDSLTCFMSHCAQQNPNAFKKFYKLLAAEKFKNILEIGTADGGLTVSLRLMSGELGLSPRILSFDIARRNWYESQCSDYDLDIRIQNIFENNSIDKEVIDFIQSEGKTLVLCDGGHKITEFNTLSHYLKDGDFIMAHDYAETQEIFKDEIYKKHWNWHEISLSDIEGSIKECQLKKYSDIDFKDAVWCCYYK